MTGVLHLCLGHYPWALFNAVATRCHDRLALCERGRHLRHRLRVAFHHRAVRAPLGLVPDHTASTPLSTPGTAPCTTYVAALDTINTPHLAPWNAVQPSRSKWPAPARSVAASSEAVHRPLRLGTNPIRVLLQTAVAGAAQAPAAEAGPRPQGCRRARRKVRGQGTEQEGGGGRRGGRAEAMAARLASPACHVLQPRAEVGHPGPHPTTTQPLACPAYMLYLYLHISHSPCRNFLCA